ncbi:MAG: Rieske (2Fe-2S) protein [Candidatus Kapaibacterium sp.]
MDNPDYIHLCSLSSLPKRFGKRFELDGGIEIALFQVDGKVYAVNNVCPHQKFPILYEGEREEHTITCPMHGWKFDIRNGRCIEGGNATLRTYPVLIEEENIYIERPEPDVPKWME